MKTLSLLPLALFSASLIACGDSGDGPIENETPCDPALEVCTPGNGGGGGGGGGGGDRQHPTYTQQELRDLGVVFPGDEGWFTPEYQPSLENADDWFHTLQMQGFTEEWIDALRNDILQVNDASCLPWWTPITMIKPNITDGIADFWQSAFLNAPNTTCIQTPYGAGLLILADLDKTITALDDSFGKPEPTGIAPTCHPTIDGIAFTRSTFAALQGRPVAYTVGSIYDARVPVSSCRDHK